MVLMFGKGKVVDTLLKYLSTVVTSTVGKLKASLKGVLKASLDLNLKTSLDLNLKASLDLNLKASLQALRVNVLGVFAGGLPAGITCDSAGGLQRLFT